MSKPKWDFRDVSVGLQALREFLLGRKHTLHGRFPPLVSSRSIPPADIPRGPEYKYSNQYYFNRNAMDSVKPPVVAPIAEGPPPFHDPTKKVEAAGGMNPTSLSFFCAPTPGLPWWWDGHCYYECVPDPVSQCPPECNPQGACEPPTSPPTQ